MFSSYKALAVIAGLVSFGVLHGLQAQPLPTFEVASIRHNPSGGGNTHINISGGRLTVENGSLKTLIRNAYQILSFQLAGEPSWLDTEMYDIVATTGSDQTISLDQLKLLLQSLLADRFRLKVHWETRDASIYALVLAQGGPKFKQSSEAQVPSINTQKGPDRARMKGSKEPISILASNLGNQLSRIVVDKTDLSGFYDWTLEWKPDIAVDSTYPTLFTAVQEQLGLRLEAQKGQIQMLVIDNAERPSENE